MKKDIEISRLKILSEKRPLQENGASSGTVSPSKKVKTHHKVENNPSEAEIFPPSSSVNGEGQLSVEDMMKDFSDKLNENIMPPRNFANDSDSDFLYFFPDIFTRCQSLQGKSPARVRDTKPG